MTDKLLLLNGQDYKINNYIKVHFPTLREIGVYGEFKYFNLICGICSTPSNYKSFLWDKLKICWENISDFDLFCNLISSFYGEGLNIIFGDLDFSLFEPSVNNENGEIVLLDRTHNYVIDSAIYYVIVDLLRTSHGLSYKKDIAGNEVTRQRMIDNERNMLKRKKNDEQEPVLYPMISAMVNSPAFKYDYNTVFDLTIYQFMDAVKRINKIREVDNLMTGIYSGCIDSSKISSDSMNWMCSLNK